MADLSDRTQAASMRAMESSKRLRRIAQKLTAEMDVATPPHGIAVTGFSEEDSLVTTIDAVIERSAAGGGKRS